MNLNDYQTITGITVASADQTRVTAEIARTKLKLESLLGYSLDTGAKTNLYNELGKTESDSCPIVDTDNLEPPDAVQGAYRLFSFDPREDYFHVDPFSRIHAVKMVYVKQGASPNGVTLKTFDDERIRVISGRDSWSKYLESFPEYIYPRCSFGYYLQVAVDADWMFTAIPDDLKSVWADMTTYYSDEKRNVRSESILTHSYSKFDKGENEDSAGNNAVLSRYAGPYGTLSRQVVV